MVTETIPGKNEQDLEAFVNAQKEKDDKLDESLGMKGRWTVLKAALFVEKVTVQMLGRLLGCDYRESKVIGHKGSPLSFNQKVQLLVDIGGLDKADIKDFTLFMEIRNTLAHDIFADSFVKTMEIVDQRDNSKARTRQILKLWEEHKDTTLKDVKEWTDEMKLHAGIGVLCGRVMDRARAIKRESQERTDHLIELAIAATLYNRFHSEGYEPFKAALGALEKDPIAKRYTSLDVMQIVAKLMDEVMGLAVKEIGEEERDNILKWIDPKSRKEATAPPIALLAQIPTTPGEPTSVSEPGVDGPA